MCYTPVTVYAVLQPAKMVVKVAVIGAGCIGLSAATVIQERFPQLPVTIFADKFSPGTTSDGAGEYLLQWIYPSLSF